MTASRLAQIEVRWPPPSSGPLRPRTVRPAESAGPRGVRPGSLRRQTNASRRRHRSPGPRLGRPRDCQSCIFPLCVLHVHPLDTDLCRPRHRRPAVRQARHHAPAAHQPRRRHQDPPACRQSPSVRAAPRLSETAHTDRLSPNPPEGGDLRVRASSQEEHHRRRRLLLRQH